MLWIFLCTLMHLSDLCLFSSTLHSFLHFCSVSFLVHTRIWELMVSNSSNPPSPLRKKLVMHEAAATACVNDAEIQINNANSRKKLSLLSAQSTTTSHPAEALVTPTPSPQSLSQFLDFGLRLWPIGPSAGVENNQKDGGRGEKMTLHLRINICSIKAAVLVLYWVEELRKHFYDRWFYGGKWALLKLPASSGKSKQKIGFIPVFVNSSEPHFKPKAWVSQSVSQSVKECLQHNDARCNKAGRVILMMLFRI